MRRTKIIATLGPASDSPEVLDAMMTAGVDVVRLNAAHAGPGELAVRLTAAREAAARAGREIGVLLDLPGPKIRIREVAVGTALETGAEFTLLTEECVGGPTRACVSYAGLADDVSEGDRILIDDGRIELKVMATAPGRVRATVVTGGPLLSNKGVNVPGVTLRVASITTYDKTLLSWAMANDVDWIGQSFVRSPRDIEDLREYMTARVIPIMAKIEKHEAADRIEEIFAVADGVMVARGDLGVETSPEEVPVLQKRIVAAARAAGKPVVVATEMLDSMRFNPRPTRAEASDVANAIFSRADAVMLSGETAVGQYPVESVETMCRIIVAAEGASPPISPPRSAGGGDDVQLAVSAAVCELATDLDLAAIVTITQSGATTLAVSRHRPVTPIIAATPAVGVARRLAMVWGAHAVLVEIADDLGALLGQVGDKVREAGYANSGERVAVTAGLTARHPGGTDFILVLEV